MNKLKPIKNFFVFNLIGALGISCAQSDSDSIASDEIYAAYTIEAGASSATCQAHLAVGGSTGTRIDLSGGDSVECRLEENSPEELSSVSSGYYEKSNLDLEVGGLYTVDFIRQEGQCSDGETHSASVIMPESLTISSSSSLNLSSNVTITWNAGSGDAVEISIEGKELLDSEEVDAFFTTSTSDDGSHTISASEFDNWTDSSGTLTVMRVNNGSFPSGLKDGYIRAVQKDTQSVTLNGPARVFNELLALASLPVLRQTGSVTLPPPACKN